MEKNSKKYQKSVSCFTLLEMMVVLMVIGLIMGLVGPKVMKGLARGNKRAAKAQIYLFETCLKDYYLDMSEYPSSGEGLDALINDPGKDGWDGPYIDKKHIPKDPWKSDYIYESPGLNGDFDITSYGADRSPGGEGDNEDITNWKE